MKKLSKLDITKYIGLLPKKYKNVKLAFSDKIGGFLNFYNDKKALITTVQESVELINIDNSGKGRPKYRNYKIKKNLSRLTINPEGKSGSYHMPIANAGECQRFLKSLNIKGDPLDMSSKLARGEIIVVRVPENREEHMKKIMKQGSSANPYFKEEINEGYSLDLYKKRWKL